MDGASAHTHTHPTHHKLSGTRPFPTPTTRTHTHRHAAFPLSASLASTVFRRCLLLPFLLLAIPFIILLAHGGRSGTGRQRSSRDEFGPGEWLALQSGYWQPRDYVKEVRSKGGGMG